MTQMIGHGFSH